MWISCFFSVVSSGWADRLLVPDDGLPVDDPEEVRKVEDPSEDGGDAQHARHHELRAGEVGVVLVGVVPRKARHAWREGTK